jgi:predicted Zn-ribbon and HTH transcriptional regulator
MKVEFRPLTCQRCGYVWTPAKRDVKRCAKCKSEYFMSPRINRRGMRPTKGEK